MKRPAFISMYVIAAVAVISLICIAIIARNWSCRKQREPRPPRPPRVVVWGPYKVASVDSGAGMVVRTGREKRLKLWPVVLEHIGSPASGEWAEASRRHLEEMAGDEVTIHHRKRSMEGLDEPDERGPMVGTVFGASGLNLCLEQVRGGYATCHAGAPEDWLAAEANAKEAERGVWSE